MLNKVTLIGYLGDNPELRYTKEKEAIARVRLATSESWKKDGEKQERTEWHNLVFFGKLAEITGDYLKTHKNVYLFNTDFSGFTDVCSANNEAYVIGMGSSALRTADELIGLGTAYDHTA